MNYDDLTPEQKQRAKALQTPEELLAFVKEEGFELSEEEHSPRPGARAVSES